MVYQKRLKKERRARKRLQEQLDLEIKRRTQLEEALKATGASSEQVRAITGTYQHPITSLCVCVPSLCVEVFTTESHRDHRSH